MSRSENDATLAAEDRALVERLRVAYAPPAPSAGGEAAFDAELRSRIAVREGRGAAWVPASVLVAAALAIWMGSALWRAADAGAPALASTWESELILGSDVTRAAQSDYLPEDYLVIADAFLAD